MVLFALNHTLLQHEELRENELHASYTTDDLIRHYNCGDLNAVVFGQDTAPVPTLSNSSLSEEDAALAKNIDLYFRQELIYNRNRRMGSRVVQLIEQNPGQSLFFAFGAGHFLGNNTVLDFVQAHGYEVEHLSVSAKIPKSKSKKSIQMDSSMKPGLRSSVALGQAKGTPFPTKKGQGRRSNRHRSTSSYQLPSSSLNLRRIFETSTSASVTTQRSRRFNDLWVRLDTYGRKMSSISSGPAIESRKVPQQAFQTWYQKSQGPDHLHSAGSRYYITDWLWLTCLLWLFSKFAYSYHQYFPMADLTGIT